MGRRGDRLVGTWKVDSLSGGSRGVAGTAGAKELRLPAGVPGRGLPLPATRKGLLTLGRMDLASTPSAPSVSNRPSARGERGLGAVAEEARQRGRG